MPVPFQGGCACGAIRYEVNVEPIAVVDCHCRDCQHSSGGSHATVVIVPKTAFRLIKGETKSHSVTADSGNIATRHFCADCGSPLFGESGAPIWAIRAGSLDDPSWLTLKAAVFTKSAQPWAHIAPNLPRFETLPPKG